MKKLEVHAEDRTFSHPLGRSKRYIPIKLLLDKPNKLNILLTLFTHSSQVRLHRSRSLNPEDAGSSPVGCEYFKPAKKELRTTVFLTNHST